MAGSVEEGFRFDPPEITVRAGDTVRWINTTGFPHNVAFYMDSVPRGAGTVLDGLMPAEGKLGPMIGRIMSQMGESFKIDFVNVPAGRYRYFSVPQEARGMVGTLIVEAQPVPGS